MPDLNFQYIPSKDAIHGRNMPSYAPRKTIIARTRADEAKAAKWNDDEYRHNYPTEAKVADALGEVALAPQAVYDWKLLYNKAYNRAQLRNNSIPKILLSGAQDAGMLMAGKLTEMGGAKLAKLAAGTPTGDMGVLFNEIKPAPVSTVKHVDFNYGGASPFKLNVGAGVKLPEKEVSGISNLLRSAGATFTGIYDTEVVKKGLHTKQ